MSNDKKLYLMRLAKVIRRNDQNGIQTLEFVRTVDDWMKQWTVENNYRAVVTANPDEAMQHWRSELERAFYSAIGVRLLMGTKVAQHFIFEYRQAEFQLDVPFWPQGSLKKINVEEITDVEEVEDTNG